MSRELKLLAKQFDRQSVTVLITNLNIYQTNINQAATPFLKQVATQAKKEKSVLVKLVAVIEEVQ
jgi:hypothetical protein